MANDRSAVNDAMPESLFAHRTLIWMGIAAAFVVITALLWYARDVFFIAFAGVLFAIFLSSLADWIARHSPLSHSWGLVVTVLGLVILLGLIGWLVQSRLLSELQQFSGRSDELRSQILDPIQSSAWGQWVMGFFPEDQEGWTELVSLSRVNRVLNTTFGAIVAVVVVLFVGLYGAAQPHWYREGLLRLVVPSRRDRARSVLDALTYNLQWWIGGQLISMTCVGVLVGLTMWWLGVPLPLTLGLIAFFLEFIPNIGPVMAAVPGLLLAWAGGGSQLALWTLLAYVVIQSLEGYVITPMVYKQAIWLPPALFLITVVLFGTIAGFLGVLLAAPLTLTLMVLVKTLYVEDTLGDRSIDVPGEPS